MLPRGHHEYSCASMQLFDELNTARFANRVDATLYVCWGRVKSVQWCWRYWKRCYSTSRSDLCLTL